MGTYNLPRNVKGEGRILFVFSSKALIYTTIGAGIGLFIYFITKMLGVGIIGIISTIVLGLCGFIIGTFKMPNAAAFQITKKTGGESLDDILKRWIKFKLKNNRIYVYQQSKIGIDSVKPKEEGGTKDE